MNVDLTRFTKECSCGHEHAITVQNVWIEENAVAYLKEIISFCCKKPKKQLLLPVIKNVIVIVLLSWLFYDNFLFSLFLIPVFFILFYQDIKGIKEKMSEEKMLEFQDLLMVLSQSLQAGTSVENSFKNALKELEKIYSAKSLIMESLYRVVNGMEMNIPIEKLVLEMAERVNEEDVKTFASVFSGAKRSGVNMVEVISFTIDSLLEKIKIKRETDTIVRAKKTEQSIMSVVPMAILLYIKLCSGDFIEALYHSFSGGLIMTVFLIVYLIAYLWSAKIMEIEV